MHHRFFTAPAGLLLGITLIGFSPSFFLKFVFEHPGGIVEQAELLRRYNQFWFARGTTVAGTRRTSLIVDPPAGRLPPYTREGEARMAAREEARRRNAGPEDRDVDERCILGFNSGPPMLPGAYNNFVQVFQGPGHVAILTEMVHNVRLVPESYRVSRRPHCLGAAARDDAPTPGAKKRSRRGDVR